MIAVFTLHPELVPEAKALAKTLGLPFQETADYWLLLTPDHLCLQKTGDKSRPLVIDFASSRMHHRITHLSLRNETLARAIGLKGNIRPEIVDATAGLARDSFILAALGCQVEMIERSPVIFALIQDGIRRGLQNTPSGAILQRMKLIHSDAITYLKNRITKPEIIYLDPMFPIRKKSALPRLDMRMFHDVAGDDPDADLLLQTALDCAAKRVVVKRPRLAEALAARQPTYTLDGQSCRFDVYLI